MTGKDRRESENRLLRAVNNIIEEEGFSKLGVNRIARAAECDKVLIYRYFGGLDGLLTEWAKENDFYTTAYEKFQEEIGSVDKGNIQELTKKILVSQLHSLRENRQMQELLLWELCGHSKFKFLQEIREKRGNELQQILNRSFGLTTNEINLYLTILITAIDYIVLYTRQYPVFNGIDFREPVVWIRLEKVIENYIDSLFNLINR